MIDLELALTDLAEHLDYPAGADLAAAVRHRIENPENPAIRWQEKRRHAPKTLPSDGRKRGRMRALIAVAAAILVVVGAVVAVSPARHAIADWIGIGAVEIHRSNAPLPPGSPSNTVPGATGIAGGTAAEVARDLADARGRMQFIVTTPHVAGAGALLGAQDDVRVPGGLIVLRYRAFTLTEIATDPTAGPVFAKVLGTGARAIPVTVGGERGFWIPGAHQVAYVNRNGQFEMDTVRRAGPVLVWEHAAVTYRVEGLHRLADAQAVASSLR